MWRDLITLIEPSAVFADPVTDPALAEAEAQLGQPIPPRLASLLRETNGVKVQHGLALVWSAERIVSDNRAFRENDEFRRLYMPFQPLCSSGTPGTATSSRCSARRWTETTCSPGTTRPTTGRGWLRTCRCTWTGGWRG